MDRILLFEDECIDENGIKRLIGSVVDVCSVEAFQNIRDYNEIDKANDALIIADVFHRDDLSEYYNVKNEEKDEEKAYEIYIEEGCKKLPFHAKAWKKFGCPIIIITKINQLDFAEILKG